MANRLLLSLCLVALAIACSHKPNDTAASPTSPSPIATADGIGGGVSGPQIVNFPARNDTVDFRRQLESKYANDLRRPTGQVYVDFEGDAAWIGEYQRMRANGCDHNTAVQRVMGQIDGSGTNQVCSVLSFPETATYASREELVDFRHQLGGKYQSMGRSFSSAVDADGIGIWVGEYLRYRSSGCDHASSVQKTLTQVDGNPAPESCVVSCAYTFSPTSLTATAAGGSFSTTAVRTSGSCEWIAGSEVPWIAVTRPIAGGANSPLSFIVEPNTSGGSRSGSIRVAYAGGNSYFNVNQPASGGNLQFQMFDPSVSANNPTTECQIRTTSSVCTLVARDGNGAPPPGNYEWRVEYTYNGSKLKTQSGALPTFSFSEACSAAGGAGSAINLSVQLVGPGATLQSGQGNQPPLQLKAFACP
jgi:hypothetical protein